MVTTDIRSMMNGDYRSMMNGDYRYNSCTKINNNINTKQNNTIETNITTQETKYLIKTPSVRDKGPMGLKISSIRLVFMRQS